MNEIGMNDETKKLYHQYLEAKATIDDLEKKISLIRPYYERTKAIYDNARLAELKSMDYQTYLKTDEWQRRRPEDLIVLCLKCHKNEHHIS